MGVYSSVESLKAYTNIKYNDLGLDNDAALTSLLTEFLEEAKSFIDNDRNRDYEDEDEVPAGINNIARRIAANMVSQAILKRQTPIIHHDDFEQDVSMDEVFTKAIRKDLKRFPAKPRFHSTLYLPETHEDDEEE